MKTLLNEDKMAIHALCKPNDISTEQAIELATKDKVLDKIKGKILDRFDYAGIEDNIKSLQSCGINMDNVFPVKKTIDTSKKMTAKEGKEFLLKIYQSRHDIVHKGALPINNSSDLTEIHNYFKEFINNFAQVCEKDKGITNDYKLLIESLTKPNS